MKHANKLMGLGGAVTLAATIALGLSAGAMLTEAVVLVSFWRSLPAQDFLAWFAANDARLVNFYGPLQSLSLVLIIVAAALAWLRGSAGRHWLVLAAALTVSVLIMYFVYFEDVNASFARGTIDLNDVSAALARWAAWQWVRTATGISAFVAAVLAVQQRMRA